MECHNEKSPLLSGRGFLLKYTFLFPALFFLGVVGCISCQRASPKITLERDKEADLKIKRLLIQPFNEHQPETVNFLAVALARKLRCTSTILPTQSLPSNAYNHLGKRYWADSIILWLSNKYANDTTLILGVTGCDIATKLPSKPNWGILGLGFMPGRACVISDYRLQQLGKKQSKLQQEMLTLALHEIGHNLGLQHCTQPNCLMKDAKGKRLFANLKDFCMICKQTIHIH